MRIGYASHSEIIRYNIGDVDIELFSENDRNVVTEAPRQRIIDFRHRTRQRSSDPPQNVTITPNIALPHMWLRATESRDFPLL